MGRGKCITLLVENLKANPMVRNAKRERAWDCAGMYQCDPEVSDYEPDRAARFAARRQLRLSVPFFRTLLLHHPDCLEHTPRESGSMGTQPWEAPARIDHILQALRADGAMGFKRHDLVLSTQFQVAPVEALLRVHTRRYIDFVRALDREVALNGAVRRLFFFCLLLTSSFVGSIYSFVCSSILLCCSIPGAALHPEAAAHAAGQRSGGGEG
jgi:hypothetical protein